MRNIPNSPLGRHIVVAACLVILVAGLKAAAAIVVPFLCALFLTVLGLPVLHWLMLRKVPKTIALILVLAAMLLLASAAVVVIGSAIAGFQGDLAGYSENLKALFERVRAWLSNHMEIAAPANDAIDPQVLLGYIGQAASQIGAVMSEVFIILLMVAFLLAESDTFGRRLLAWSDDQDATRERLERIGHGITQYFSIKIGLSALTGVLIGVLLKFSGVDYPALWAFLAFLLNFVPNIGSFLAAIPPLLLALVQPELAGNAVVTVAVGFVVVNVIIGNVLEPRLIGRGLDLSGLVVFLSLVFWGWVLGPIGMLLSVPLTMTSKIALEAFPEGQPIARLLGREVNSTPS